MENMENIIGIDDIHSLEDPEVMITRKEHSVSGIYAIINITNKRIYVGSTINLYKRKNEHFSALKSCKHHNSFLQNDFNKCGEKSFVFMIIFFCSNENLLFNEQKYIDKFFDNKNMCYNISPSASNMLGYKHTQETKDKMSKTRKGVRKPEGFGEKVSASLLGVERPKGKNAPRSKTVYSFDKNTGLFVKEFGSTLEAQRNTGVSAKSISSCCLGNRKSAGGFVWKYIKYDTVEPVKKYQPTNEHKKAISKKLKGRRIHKNTLKRLLDPEKNPFSKKGKAHPKFGKQMSATAKEKISISLKNHSRTKEHCNNISKSLSGKKLKKTTIKKFKDGRRKRGNNSNAKKVIQFDANLVFIKIWDCMADAFDSTGVSVSSISNCCRGRIKSAGGFIWEYFDE